MTEHPAVRRLLDEFPALPVGEYADERELPYIIYGIVFADYIKSCLHGGSQSALEHIFSFLEEMWRSPDEEERSLLQVAVLEALWNERFTFEAAQKYMHPETAKLFSEIGAYLYEPAK